MFSLRTLGLMLMISFPLGLSDCRRDKKSVPRYRYRMLLRCHPPSFASYNFRLLLTKQSFIERLTSSLSSPHYIGKSRF
ncbi:hypothetical protein BDZ88DRAFT_411882 [Geranomyces variabilis]|nr:hypothetical protein BDZ88DRAFT_411882 [Geranomyces variabilis]